MKVLVNILIVLLEIYIIFSFFHSDKTLRKERKFMTIVMILFFLAILVLSLFSLYLETTLLLLIGFCLFGTAFIKTIVELQNKIKNLENKQK